MVEFWRAGGANATTSATLAQAAEAEGWDGQMFMDSQSLSGDPFVAMGAWAASTHRLKLCTGVTNPLTRHPAVIAASAAMVQSVSGGRAVLGIGRGDFALAHLGYAPVKLEAFQRSLNQLQALLRGDEVAFDKQQSFADAQSVESLSLSDRPTTIRLQWLPEDLPKVPLDVAATGPKVIEMSTPIAERVTFSVGANPERVSWALDLALEARKRAGLDNRGITYGVQIVVVCHPDLEAVRAAATSFVAPFARFQVIQGDAVGPMSNSDAETFAAVRRGYDMTKHSKTLAHDKIKGTTISWEFVERFAIVGPPEYCIGRLLALHGLGIDRFVVVGPGFHPEADGDGTSLFAREVMPAVRAAVG